MLDLIMYDEECATQCTWYRITQLVFTVAIETHAFLHISCYDDLLASTGMSMRLLFAILLTSLATTAALPTMQVRANSVEATQLVMMEEDGCPWCNRWMEEIGDSYHNTTEGQTAPLRRVDVHGPIPSDLRFLKPAYFTPTFILVSGGREVGRIKGYPGEDFFWPLLAELLNKLEPAGQVEAQAAR